MELEQAKAFANSAKSTSALYLMLWNSTLKEVQ